MADRGRYFLVPLELVPGQGAANEAEAIALASSRTAVDGKARAVVRVCAKIVPPSPAPVVIRYNDSAESIEYSTVLFAQEGRA